MEFEFEDSDRVYQIHYEDEGSGPAVVLLNGVYMNCRSWSPVVPDFTRAHRLIRLDFIDQGKSQKAMTDYDLRLQSQLVIALLDHLKLRQVRLVGTSYGGVVALQVAARQPERIRCLVISNTGAHFSRIFNEFSNSLSVCFDRLAWTLQPRVFGALSRITRSIADVDERANLERITCPTLVIATQFDSLTPRRLQLELVNALPNASFAEISGASHVVIREKPKEFAALALDFIENSSCRTAH